MEPIECFYIRRLQAVVLACTLVLALLVCALHVQQAKQMGQLNEKVACLETMVPGQFARGPALKSSCAEPPAHTAQPTTPAPKAERRWDA